MPRNSIVAATASPLELLSSLNDDDKANMSDNIDTRNSPVHNDQAVS